jgi:hypothetical protein
MSVQRRTQILPFGVRGFDQSDLLLPQPTFDLLFRCYCSVDVVADAVVDQLGAVVLRSEALYGLLFVFVDPAFEVISYSRVENTPFLVGHDVNAVLLHLLAFCHSESAEGETKNLILSAHQILHFVQNDKSHSAELPPNN